VHKLHEITALGKSEAISLEIGPFSLKEVTNTVIASYSFRKGSEKLAKKNIEKFVDDRLADIMSCNFGNISSFWVGPEQWFIEAKSTDQPDLAQELNKISKGTASVTEQTDAWCRFDLSGDYLEKPFSLLCNVDVPSFTGTEITRCQIDHLGCFLICRDLKYFTVLGPRSAAGSLHHAIVNSLKAVA